MVKELEALKTIKIKCHPNSNPSPLVDEALDTIENALNRLEAIDNANPSEALELAEWLECDLQATNDLVTRTINGYDYLDILETIKQALLKAQENARSEEILQKYYQEGITLDSVRALREENAELRQKTQEPKKYLKWEDLDFDVPTTIKVKMGDTQYLLSLRISLSDVKSVVLRDNNLKPFLHLFEKEKQFFNDLHLERVEE